MNDDTIDRLTAEMRTAKDGIEIEMMSESMVALATVLKLKSPAEKALELQIEQLAPWGINVYIDRMRRTVEVFYETGSVDDIIFQSERRDHTFNQDGYLVVGEALEDQTRTVVRKFFERINQVDPEDISVGPLPAALM